MVLGFVVSVVLGSVAFGDDVPVSVSTVANNLVGPHQRVMLFKKNENPQNVMVIYTKTNSSCQFVSNTGKPTFDFYWLMNGRDYKPVHSLIKSGIQERMELEIPRGADGKSSFFVKVNDLNEMKHDLENPRLLVRAVKSADGKCNVESLMTMGPSDQRAVVRLDNIYATAETTFLPPFRKVVSVTVNGVNTKTGRAFSRTFHKR